MKIGIDIGGSHIAIGVVQNNEIIIKKEHDIDRESFSKDSLITMLAKDIIKFSEKYKINLIGVSFCGLVREGIIEKAPNLTVLEGLNLEKELKNILPVQIKIRNDVKCAALAEMKYGSLRNYYDAAFVAIGTGIGGAYINHGKLLQPLKSSGLEFGHMVINYNGKKCGCGSKGCFEQYASITALKNMVCKKLNLERNITGKELIKVIKQNKKELENELLEYAKYVAIGISNIINIFEPEVIAFGGSFVYYRDILFDKVLENITCMCTLPEFVWPEFKNDAGLIGACVN